MKVLRLPDCSVEYAHVRRERVRFAARKDASPQSMWWRFALADCPAEVECVWERTGEVLGGGGLAAVVPVYRHDGAWRRVPVRSCRHDAARHEFHFRAPTSGGRVEVAYCYPYELARAEALPERLGREVRVTTLCPSELGRPFRLIELGRGPRHVWLTARHHAGEVSGAYVLEGLLRRAARWPELLERMTLHAAPVMDVDGVAEGMYGKDRAPRDYNRDYVARPVRPEVAALIQAAEAAGRVDYFCDFHAPAPGDGSFMVPCEEVLSTPEAWRQAWELARVLEALAPAGCPCRVADRSPGTVNWYGDLIGQTASHYFHQCFGAVAWTLETTYHRSWNRRLVTPQGWQGLGAALLEAIAVQEGLWPTPAVEEITLPEPMPRLRHWACLSYPPLRLRERGRTLTVTGPEPAHGAVMQTDLQRSSPGTTQLQVRLQGSLERLVLVAKAFDPATGRPTGEVRQAEFSSVASGAATTLTCPTLAGDARLICRLEGLQGRLELSAPRAT